MVKTIPQMYRYIYQRAERATEVGPFRSWAQQFAAQNLRALIERERPDAVVCTHAFPCGAMAEYKRMFTDAPPVVGVVTDFAVHAFWMYDNIDAYSVATEDLRDAMIARGIAPERIAVTGIPVEPHFADRIDDAGALREELGIPSASRAILIMGGGLGIGPIVGIMRELTQIGEPLCAVVMIGKNRALGRRVMQAAQALPYPVRVVPFVGNVYDYMHACDVFVTKPGGLSIAEALAARIPLVLLKPLPGQEERNARFLLDRGAAVRARNAGEAAAAVEHVLRDADRLRSSGAAIAHPEAAHEVASILRGFTVY